jgi:hypothetical protein
MPSDAINSDEISNVSNEAVGIVPTCSRAKLRLARTK